jgi:adenylate cyclase
MEIERKFLLTAFPPELSDSPSTAIEQGYLVIGEGGAEARVRRRDGRCTLTVKAGKGVSRAETEIALGADQFEALWPATAGRRVEKTRHEVPLSGGLLAEVDVYAGALEGLVVAEVEFTDLATADGFVAPAWLGAEITDDDGYKNRRLAVDGRPA